MTSTTTLIRQLRAILQLTQTEAQVARLRTAQARTDAVRRELTQNAANAERRSRLIADQLRELGGVPDAVTPLIGRVTALLKSTVEQVEPFDEALLQDLALEQQLLGRARYLKALAEGGRKPAVRALAEQLETAHAETVEWISIVLAEEALGGPAALRATPLQRATGGVTKVIGLPVRAAREGMNRAMDGAQEVGDLALSTVAGVTNRAKRLGGATREVAVSGRDASLSQAEAVARREGARDTEKALHETRRELGSLSERELPISGYDELNQQEAVRRIKELGNSADVRTIVNYEEAHRNRPSVVAAAQTRVAALAKETVGS
ncbi:MAG TPA: ferritin-like domain-containing protein [Pseudonocardia sp.]|uniref:ferritin-like domain-containing protein n=1 Tax=Pseudonocardia sp. TaxID=60912 RepID=UPI002BF23134|nr:ferritin-like domain-containing protein [Pseudonocardia sp.]HTF50215.1 ferritin-like domain-containing protein [Pseudonocardia sp.]